MRTNHPLIALALAPLLGLGCATSTVAERESTPLVSPPPERPFDPATFAAQFSRPQDCEEGARELKRTRPAQGWAALKACVKQGNFKALQTIAAHWATELQTRPDAPLLLAEVIAMRGGSVESDLALLHKEKVPLFSLEDAFAQPQIYGGRYVVLRAKVEETRMAGASATAKVTETTLRSEGFEAPLAGRVHHYKTESSGSYGTHGRGVPGGGSVSTYQSSVDHSASTSLRRYENVSVETGRNALIKLTKVDPFFGSGREYVVVARFDGLRASSAQEDDDEPEQIAALTLVSYEEPAALVMY